MNGFNVCGRPIKVNLPTGVLPPPGLLTQTSAAKPPPPKGNRRVYVGSIPWELKEEDVKQLFESCGKIVSCQLIVNPETGQHKGFGFIEFSKEEEASLAKTALNNFDIIPGRPLRVGSPTIQ